MRIEGVHLLNRANQNNDGFDLTNCEDVIISDCHIDCGDDAIALKEGGIRIVVTNCIISTRWAAFRIGPEAHGVFRDIAVSNCVVYDTYGSGIKIQEVEGGVMENISFDNLVMNHVTGPISLRLGGYLGWKNERKESLPIGVLRNIRFSNIQATVADNAYPLPHEVPACPAKKNRASMSPACRATSSRTSPSAGSASPFPAAAIMTMPTASSPSCATTTPNITCSARCPPTACICAMRRASRLKTSPSMWPAPTCARRWSVTTWKTWNSPTSAPPAMPKKRWLRLCDARQVYIHGCRPLGDVGLFLSVEGAASQGILLQANDLRRAATSHAVADGAGESAVVLG